jgi:ankyrin repeat protein
MPRLEALLDKGAPIEWRNGRNGDATPLIIACQCGNLAAAELLCARGADLEAHGYMGRTPLIIACHSGDHAEVAACLLAFGADPTVSQGSATALCRAREDEHAKCVALLEHASLTTEQQDRFSRKTGFGLMNDSEDEEKESGRRLAAIVREARGGQPTQRA